MSPELTNFDVTMGVLSSMIIPAVLISACGSLTVSTANRLGRAVDRTRKISERFAALDQVSLEERKDEVTFLAGQLSMGAARTRILHAALAILYLALGLFAATSVAIGIVALSGRSLAFVAGALGVGGATLLLVSVLLLVWETRISGGSIKAEMRYLLQRHKLPPDVEIKTE